MCPSPETRPQDRQQPDSSTGRQASNEAARSSEKQPPDGKKTAETDHRPEATPNHPPVSEADLTPEEQEEKEKVRQEVKAALEQLHTALQTKDHPARIRITAAIDQTFLVQLSPIFKRQLSSSIEQHPAQDQKQEAFVDRGLAILDFWIHLQGLKRGTDRALEQVRRNLNAAA